MLHVCNIASMTLSPLHTHPFPRTLYPHHHSPTLTITPPFSFSLSISSNSNFKKFPTLCTTPSSTTHPPLSPNYNETLLQLTQTSSFDSIKTLIKQMKSSGFTPNDVAFVTLIQRLTNFQEIEQVLNILENELGFYNLALNALVDDNKLKLVEILHSKMVCEGIVLDVSTFNVLIKALCKTHQLNPAILMFEDMVNHRGLNPGDKTFTTLMQGFIEQDDLNGALKIKKQMLGYGCLLTNVSVNVLVNGFCKDGRVEEALKFVNEVYEEGFYADHVTFNSLVNGFCRIGNVNDALDNVDLMIEKGFDPDVYTYNSLISETCNLGEFDKAMEILQQMILRDCAPNTLTYNTLINALCKENEMEAATDLARILVSKGLFPDVCTFNTLIKGLCSSKNRDNWSTVRLPRQLGEERINCQVLPFSFIIVKSFD